MNYETRKRKSMRSERKLAQRVGGWRTPASGALAIKGDVQTDALLIELKETDKAEFRLRLADLVKVSREAYGSGKEPAFVIQWNRVAQGVCARWILQPLD